MISLHFVGALLLQLAVLTLSGCALHERLAQREGEAAQARVSIEHAQKAFEARTNNPAEKRKAQVCSIRVKDADFYVDVY